MPKVSVIVPNFNHAPYLQQRIDSILNQTYQDFELILLDDCSTDNSREVLDSYRDNPHVTQMVYNETNGGSPFAQWNKGIELAQGEWIWIAESDDWAEPDFLETLIEQVENHPTSGLVFGLARYVCDGKELWKIDAPGTVITYTGEDFVKNRLVFGNVVYNVSMTLFRKSLFEQVDASLYGNMKLCGDWFFYAQLCAKSDVVEVRKIVSNYRFHNHNTSSTAEIEGLSFLEGLDVLDYMAVKFGIKSSVYNRIWGRQWARYYRKYNYTKAVNGKIRKKVMSNHFGIFAYYLLYRLRYSL